MVKHTLFCSTDEKPNTFFYSVLYELVLFLLQFSNHTKELRDNYRNNIVGWFYLNTPTVFNRIESLESLGQPAFTCSKLSMETTMREICLN